MYHHSVTFEELLLSVPCVLKSYSVYLAKSYPYRCFVEEEEVLVVVATCWLIVMAGLER